jgi:indolepyruvate decarboxylase
MARLTMYFYGTTVRIPEILGTGMGFDINTEDQLEEVLQNIHKYSESFCILDVHIDPKDSSPALQRITSASGKTS